MNRELIESLIKHSVEAAAEISPVFTNRTDAGSKLADVLQERKYINPVLMTIPAGGVPVALSINERLGLPTHLIFAAKIRFSSDRRFGIGAVSVNGDLMLNKDLLEDLSLDTEFLQRDIEEARRIVIKRKDELNPFFPSIPDLNGRTVILTDDGIASGYTVMAAAKSIESLNPDSIVIASPVTSREAYEKIDKCGYEQVVLVRPESTAFLVDNFYKEFLPVSTAQVKDMQS